MFDYFLHFCFRFDLQLLHHPQYYSARVSDELSYEINVCGPIRNGSCSGKHTSICMVYNNKTVVPIDATFNIHFNSSNLKFMASYTTPEHSKFKGN